MGKRIDKIVEGYKPIPMKRMFYPRKFNLSEEFINAFHREYDRLVGEGLNPKTLVERFGKAMRFHQSESRKYHQLDEESANKRAAAAKKATEDARRKKERKQGKAEAQEPNEAAPSEKKDDLGKNIEKWSKDDS